MKRLLNASKAFVRFPGEIRQRGWAVASRRLLKQFYSSEEFHVYIRPPGVGAAKQLELPEELHISHLTDKDCGRWLALLAKAWPPELEQYRGNHLSSALRGRLGRGEICVIAHRGGSVLGAAWLTALDGHLQACGPPFDNQARCVKSLFVVPEARGMGISHFLLRELSMIADRHPGVQMVSLISRARIASIRAHESAGFVLTGSMITGNRLFAPLRRMRSQDSCCSRHNPIGN